MVHDTHEMENRDSETRRTSVHSTSTTPHPGIATPASQRRASSDSHRSDVHDQSFDSIELQERPRRSLSGGYGTREIGENEEVEESNSRRSSLAIPSERHHVGSALRRSLLQRNPRPDLKGNHVPAAEIASPSQSRISRSSSLAIQRPESPYQGATGPSQPYGMYSQDIGLSRTTSVATTSQTQRPERTYSGPNGPTQPYGMYPQNTVEENEGPSFGTSVPPAPVTYPAGARPAPQAHQRRLGPDGEDLDDLIGPYGFAEQLPPYSRYPNDIPPKRDPDASSFVLGEPSNSQSQATPPQPQQPSNTATTVAAPIPTSDPTPYSESTATHVADRRSNTSNHIDADIANPQIGLTGSPNTASSPNVQPPQPSPFSDTSTQGSSTAIGSKAPSEKGSLKERMQKRASKRCCWGIVPCWLLVFVAALLIAVGIGGILGGLLAHDANSRGNTSTRINTDAKPAEVPSTVTITSIIPAQTPDDVDPVASPSGVPPIPTGSFTVTLDQPSTTTNSCLTDTLQNNAWDCSTGANLNVTINLQNNAPYISLTYPSNPGQIQYGAQPPQLNGPSSLLYMRDKSASATGLGNAYGFKQPFNKTVIVRSQDFPGAMAKRSLRWAFRRWLTHQFDTISSSDVLESRQLQQSDWNMTSLASVSDKPWLCTWNGTFLTGFIYVATSVTSQPQYPKSMKIIEKRPMMNPPPATCQQMQVQKDFTMKPLTLDDGSYNIALLQEQTGSDEDDNDANSQAMRESHRWRKRAEDGQIGGPRCECAWQST